MECAESTFDLFQDISGAGGPDGRLRFWFWWIDVISDRGDKFFDIVKDAAPTAGFESGPERIAPPCSGTTNRWE
jgi:hypothetical protein